MTSMPVIAIDGPAASGKGTLARKIAAHMDFAHMDTGLLYRAVGMKTLQAGYDPHNEAAAVKAAEDFSRHFGPNSLSDPALRSDQASAAASQVASIKGVRMALLKLQQDFAARPPALSGSKTAKGAVLDGRDIGTVICPAADVKLYIAAAVEVRAERRLKELHSKGIVATYEAVLRDMRDRDARDAERLTAPMRVPEDAYVIETSALDQDQVLEKALEFIKSRLPASLSPNA